jgi:hypothetical protein
VTVLILEVGDKITNFLRSLKELNLIFGLEANGDSTADEFLYDSMQGQEIFFFHSVPSGFGAPPNLPPNGHQGLFSGGKAAGE